MRTAKEIRKDVHAVHEVLEAMNSKLASLSSECLKKQRESNGASNFNRWNHRLVQIEEAMEFVGKAYREMEYITGEQWNNKKL